MYFKLTLPQHEYKFLRRKEGKKEGKRKRSTFFMDFFMSIEDCGRFRKMYLICTYIK